ncbi:MAG: response regulator, partial [Desulfobacterales bacterium]|nr:response regulator [Desulfobacterales bacterium]
MAFNLMVASLETREIEINMIIETANAPIFAIDRDGTIVKWNKKAEDITGYSKDEVIGKKSTMDIIEPDSYLLYNNIVDKAFSGNSDSNIEIFFITKSRNKIDILLNISPRKDIEGNIIGAIIMGQDITDRRRFQEELEHERESLAQRVQDRTNKLMTANAELSRAARLKDEFLANMSHELRTPLSSILGMTEVLNEQIYGQLNEKQLSFLKTIEDSGRHLLSLINDILDISKIEAGKLKVQISPVFIPSICEISLRFIKQIAAKKRIKVQSKLMNIEKTIGADEIRLKQILVNLLSNAVKFTQEGGNVGLEVYEDNENSVTQFTVWDTGIGIAKEDISKLFQPFIQLDTSLSRKYEGAGLGLALVSRLAKIQGGDVKVESTLGQGSKFTVSIPWNNLDDNKNNNPKEIIDEDTDDPLFSNKETGILILIVDDVKENLNTFSYYLKAKGYSIITAQSGTGGIKMAISEHPDLILMDIQMPEMDGLEAISRIRSYNELKSIPIIAITALAMPGDDKRCLDAGANMYISKPVKLKQLVIKISELLNRA